MVTPLCTSNDCVRDIILILIIRAAETGDLAVVELLLAGGADTSITEDNYGKTASKIAEEMNQVAILEAIRKADK